MENLTLQITDLIQYNKRRMEALKCKTAKMELAEKNAVEQLNQLECIALIKKQNQYLDFVQQDTRVLKATVKTLLWLYIITLVVVGLTVLSLF